LTAALGKRGELYRLSGDEFAVTCPTGDTLFVTTAIAQSIQTMKANGFEFAGASHGSVHRSETESLEQLKHVADQRMYEEKHRRKSVGQKRSAL
jgi:diguanylate cyclase